MIIRKVKLDIEKSYFLLLFLLIVNLFFFNNMNLTIDVISIIYSVIATFELVLGMILWSKKGLNINHPFVYFMITCFICWFGQMLFVALGFDSVNDIVIKSFNPNEFLITAKYAVLGFGCLFLGGILFSKQSNYNQDTQKYIEDKQLYKIATIVALFMILFGVIPHYYTLFSSLVKSLQDGYFAVFGNSYEGIFRSIYNVFSSLSMFFWPGMFLLLVANRNNKKVFLSIGACIVLEVLVLFMIGTRSEALALLLTFFWLFTTFYKKINLKFFLIMLLIGFLLLRLLGIVNAIRTSETRTLGYFIELFFTLPLGYSFEILREFGFNIFSLHHTIRLVPSVQDFGLGYTYFASIMAVIPSLLMGGYSFSNAAALPEWLMTTLNMDYGPGYSILAESYYNFGLLGFIAMFAIGIIISKIFNNQKKGDWQILYNAFICTFLYTNLFIARDTVLLVVRKYFYLIIIPIFFIKFLHKNAKMPFIAKCLNFLNPLVNFFAKDNFPSMNKNILIINNNLDQKMVNKIENIFQDTGYQLDIYNDYSDSNTVKRFLKFIRKINSKSYFMVLCSCGDIGYLTCKIHPFVNFKKYLITNKKQYKMELGNDFSHSKFDLVVKGYSKNSLMKIRQEIIESGGD